MSLLKKLFGSDKKETATESPAAPACAHVVLVPRWDNPDDMGNDDRASAFRCEGCGAVFTPDEARRLRADEAARVAERVGA
jgi:hypothetical protein